MIKHFLTACSALAMATTSVSAQDTTPKESDVPAWLKKDFVDFTSTFAGQWNSDRHVFFAEQAGYDLSIIAPRQHLSIEQIESDMSKVESYRREYRATRTRKDETPIELIHTVTLNTALDRIQQLVSVPNGAHFNCVILWHREAAQFVGAAQGADCAQIFPQPSDGGALDVRLAKSADEFWVMVKRGDNRSEARLRRARPFECWTAILRGAEHGDSGEGMRDWDFRRGVTLHDQGGEAVLITDEETPRKIRLRLRNVDWPYGTNRPSLTLYVLEGDDDRAVSYAWNEGNAERIGLNLRWLQASCTYVPDSATE